jgi:hypothetical protein
MDLEDYWGVGPKTRELLEAELGTAAAVEAIESGDVRTLVEAGLGRGRATRILRRADGGAALAVLATPDAREVYKSVLDHAVDYAVTASAADRIRVLTPLATRSAMTERLDAVEGATETWGALSDEIRAAVLSAFDAYEAAGGERAAVAAALDLRNAGAVEGPFAPLADLDGDALEAAADALGALGEDGSVAEGTDDRLDGLRTELAALEGLEGAAFDVVETVRSGTDRSDEFRESFRRYVHEETGVARDDLRAAEPADAADAADFVSATLRELVAAARERVAEREAEVRADLEATVTDARADVDAAVGAVDDIAFFVSLARFARDFGLTRPEFVDAETVAVVGARNLELVAAGGSVQPVTYAVGDHGLDIGAPDGDRVAVLTGANSGGKTTLLETLCQVALLARMGLPVPAERAAIGPVDAVVFHRRHASFNAGVLESTLRSVVPPLTDAGRTLMLVDEFEAITEPGSAADLLHGLVTLTVEREAMGVFVTHLAADLEPLPAEARVDGIVAEGLDRDLELRVDYQPRFGSVGHSTPEFIVSRLVADATDRETRGGYRALAEAVGEEAVQRTLADARWTDDGGDGQSSS